MKKFLFLLPFILSAGDINAETNKEMVITEQEMLDVLDDGFNLIDNIFKLVDSRNSLLAKKLRHCFLRAGGEVGMSTAILTEIDPNEMKEIMMYWQKASVEIQNRILEKKKEVASNIDQKDKEDLVGSGLFKEKEYERMVDAEIAIEIAQEVYERDKGFLKAKMTVFANALMKACNSVVDMPVIGPTPKPTSKPTSKPATAPVDASIPYYIP